VSDIEVIVPMGPTNIDIKMTNFFQKQNIPTKVQNKKINVEKDVVLIKPGDVVNGTHLKIIELLELCPFKFKVQIKCVWDKGNIFGREVIYAKDEDTLARLQHGINHMNGLALATGFAHEGSLAHSVTRAVKSLASLSHASGVDAHELESLVSFLKDPSKFASVGQSSAPTGANAKKEVKVEAVKVEEVVVEDVDLGGGLFGGGDDDW